MCIFWTDIIINLCFYALLVVFTYMQASVNKDKDEKHLFSYAIVPKYLSNFVLIFSIVWIRCYVNKYAKGKFSVRELLVLLHTTLFFFSIALQLARYILDKVLQNLPDDANYEIFRVLKSVYIVGATARVLNIALLLLFFYMAVQFNGKLLTGYKESFDRLQKLQIFAAQEGHAMRNRHARGTSSFVSTMREKAVR